MEVNEKATRNIFIVNSGKFNFDYNWCFDENHTGKPRMVTVTPDAGGVMFGERQRCQLAFCPPSKAILRGCEMMLMVYFFYYVSCLSKLE